jgi:hypothetical protein
MYAAAALMARIAQTCPVMGHSILAVVGRGDGHGDHFPVTAAEFARRVHDRAVELQMGLQECRARGCEYTANKQLKIKDLMSHIKFVTELVRY